MSFRFHNLSPAAVVALGCTRMATEVREVSAFREVSVNDGVELVLTIDADATDTVELEVTAPADILEDIVTEAGEDRLLVHVFGGPPADLEATVTTTAAELVEITAGDGGRVVASGLVEPALELDAHNRSGIDVSGDAYDVLLEAGGGSTVSAENLQATVATVSLDGGASAVMCVTDAVDGSVDDGALLTVLCGGDTSGVFTSGGGSVD